MVFVVISADQFQALLGRQVALRIAHGRGLGMYREPRRNLDGMEGIYLRVVAINGSKFHSVPHRRSKLE